jgi:hypothetical protein
MTEWKLASEQKHLPRPEEYPVDHFTASERAALIELLGLPEGWNMPTVRIFRDSPKFVELQRLLVVAGVSAAFRRKQR